MDSNPKWEPVLRPPFPMDSWDERVVALEKLLCDLIVTQGRREKVLLSQLANLQAELNRRSVAFQHTLMHYERRLQQINSKKQGKNEIGPADSDSGVGEEQLTLHLAVVLNRHKGSLGFSIAGRNTPRKDCKDLVVSHISPTGPAKGKLLLQDKVIKVNGVEIGSLGHDEAVAVFKAAQEPIVLEVLRQLPVPWIRLSETSTQTESISENTEESATKDEKRSKEHLDEVLNEYDIEYEEVMLPKSDADTKLGLTLCCAPELQSDVFISDVDPQSVAGRDGRIRSGDQVVQVNGVDVQTTDQAAELFSAEKSVVAVVVARPLLKTGTEEEPKISAKDRADDFASPLINHFPSLLSLDRVHPQSILEEDEEEDDDDDDEEDDDNPKPSGVLKSEAVTGYEEGGVEEVEKDSGVERTDDSIRNEESSEQESLRDSGKLPSNSLSRSGNEVQDSDLVGSLSAQRDCVGDGAGRQLASRSVKLADVASGRSQNSVDKSEAVEMWVESTACKGSLLRRLDEELCLSMFLPPPPSEGDSDTVSLYSCECCKCHCPSTVNAQQQTDSPPASPSTLYTNHNNLARTIKLQQQLFRRALLSSSSTTTTTSSSGRQTQSVDDQTTTHESTTPLEWKVKRRTDGSRYIVRRPVRNRLLKERANRLAEERGGITTDDDAMSELKAGRYWSKEERKKHLERSRERQRRKEEHFRLKTDGGGPGMIRPQDSSGQTDILELSRRKMMRIKGKSLFDDFTTVQEVLVHGSRIKGPGKAPHKLLSVTTV